MKKVQHTTLLLGLMVALLAACVPARKFEEIKTKQKQCAEENQSLRGRVQELETQNKEQSNEITDLTKRNVALTADTSVQGASLRQLRVQYDKIDALNDEIIAKLERLQKGSAAENQKLLSELEIMRIDLQRKEDALKQLESELAVKKADLDKLSADLAEREKRVNELEALIAKKDAAVKALRDKVAEALLSFKDKGLTVEQRNGKVYVSLEAKLLFASGSTVVDSKGKEALVKLAKVLEDQADIQIMVEGHTDTDKIKSSSIPRNNWELSVLRSTAVTEIILGNSTIDAKRLTAAGRGEFSPIDPADKAKNRRIEVVLTPNLDELFKILEEN